MPSPSSSSRLPKAPAAPRSPVVEFWGLPLEKWREIAGFITLVLAFLLFLAMLSSDLQRGWMGFVGENITFGLRLAVGRYCAYVLPGLLLLATFHAFRGSLPFHPIRKAFAALLFLVCLCGLFALPDYLGDDQKVFLRSGALGTFLLAQSGDGYGLGLGGRIGPAGCMVVFISGLVVGAMLSTEFLFIPIVRTLLRWMHALMGFFWGWRKKPGTVLRMGCDAAKRLPVFTEELNADVLEAAQELAQTDAASKKSSSKTKQPASSEPDMLSNVLDEEESDEPASLIAKLTEREKAAKDEDALGKKKNAKPEPLPMQPLNQEFEAGDFVQPPLNLFTDAPPAKQGLDREEVLQTSGELEKALADFGISARVVDVRQGPVVTQYELQPAPGVKVSRILSLENDMALILKAKSVRIQAPIPGKAAIGIEVPNRSVTPVFFKELLSAPDFLRQPSPLAFVLGKNISGEAVICDLAAMPHLLVAGTTGSGKSVCVNVIISSILFRMPPDKVKFIMIDPKRVELNVYSDIPHLLAPVVNEPRQAAAALMWAVQQMEERLRVFSDLRVRNIDGYNAVVTGKRTASTGVDSFGLQPLPHIVIIIDELADLMIVAKNEVEDFIVRLAQMSRAAGIHMIIATQRPSVNVLTGIIKANFPSRIAFRVSAKVDSRTILDMNGAETLLGKGDMLFSPGGQKPLRIQGAFLSDHDVEKLTDHLRAQSPTTYEKENFTTAEPGEGIPGDIVPMGMITPEAPASEMPKRARQFEYGPGRIWLD